MIQTPLQLLHERLVKLSHKQTDIRYSIPRLWLPPHTYAGIVLLDNPARYYQQLIAQILQKPQSSALGSPAESELVYLAFPRYTTAWDHDGSGTISYEPGRDGWRQTGTFLKMIALLPYLRWLGVSTILLLPITSHGRYHRKGMLGSPYAPYDHTSIEETLSEPLLDVGAETECAAFVEACHRLGIRVIIELALRIASLDSPLIAQQPGWFYWVRADAPDPLHPPVFSKEQIAAIEKARITGQHSDLLEPDPEYRDLFVSPPVHVEWRRNSGYVGITADGIACRVPNAFSDYPPDDRQPLWTDVTYLKLYTHPAYQYIAYNTVRLFAAQLQGWENHSLWDYLSSIVPSYLKRFDIDGIMFDMGHAFPIELHRRILERARKVKPTLFLIEESFDTTDRTAIKLGYNAVVGDTWHHARNIAVFQQYRQHLQPSVPYFATPDTHNTPRVATSGLETTFFAFALCRQLPMGIPLITTGSELGEQTPINTGLDFSPEEIAAYPPEQLPLFSGSTLCWHAPDTRILRFIHALYGKRPS